MSGKKKVFGEGFDAFEGKKDFIDKFSEKVATVGESVMEIPTEKIKVKENVRKEYAGIEDLAESIKAKGLLQPIVVTKSDDGFFEIVFGHRRYKAFLHLGEKERGAWLKIKAIVKDKDMFDPDELKEVQLIENIQRESLSPLELKDALEYFRSRGFSNGEIGKRLGKSKGYVDNLFTAVKAIRESPGLEELAKTHAGVSLTDFIETRVLGLKDREKILMAKARGEIKNREELREKIQQIREESYRSGKTERAVRTAKPYFTLKESHFRVRSISLDLEKSPAEEKKRVALALREALAKLEGAAT